jgi:SAM-dependent MidA family methyltransferase
VKALGVEVRGEQFVESERDADAALSAEWKAVAAGLPQPLDDEQGYRTELCTQVNPWIASLSDCLSFGAIFLFDYGLPRAHYYHPQRTTGTLRCHFKHTAHDDPFINVGVQDITAWVDFSACAEAASAAGFEVAGFTTQGQYLLSLLAALPPELAVDLKSPREQSAMKTLILPGEMGERFKVLLLRKGVRGSELPGKDFRYRL